MNKDLRTNNMKLKGLVTKVSLPPGCACMHARATLLYAYTSDQPQLPQ